MSTYREGIPFLEWGFFVDTLLAPPGEGSSYYCVGRLAVVVGHSQHTVSPAEHGSLGQGEGLSQITCPDTTKYNKFIIHCQSLILLIFF